MNCHTSMTASRLKFHHADQTPRYPYEDGKTPPRGGVSGE